MRKTGKKRLALGKGPDIYQQMNEKLWLNNIGLEKRPHLTISEWCHRHIKELHKEYPREERLALCKIEKRWPWDFYLVDMIHPEQSTSSGSVTATDEWMEWAVQELQERWEDLGLWNCVLHSHHWMSCFWSWTDDNARKELNDGRFMAFAVVTAYSWTWDNMEVDYKGCVNFYKPYNIEIDCDMYYEDGEIESNYDKYLEEYFRVKEEIFEDKIKAREDELYSLMAKPDYTRVLDYLGLDIKDILQDNYWNVVMRKMANPQVDAILKACENEAKEEAEEKLKENKELMEWMEEFTKWSIWSEDLSQQLENHKKIKAKTYKWWDEYMKSEDYKKLYSQSQSNRFFEDDELVGWYDDDQYFYCTTRRFPTSDELRAYLQLRPEVSIIQVNWNWKVYSKANNRYVYADEFDENEDWESCFWTDRELEEFQQREEEKKENEEKEKKEEPKEEEEKGPFKDEKTDEEKAEDVLHWLFN